MKESVARGGGHIQDGGENRGQTDEFSIFAFQKSGIHPSGPDFPRKLLDCVQDNLALFDACQRSKSAPNMKNLRPIWTMRMRSSSMILRKCRTEKPASSAALGMSRNVFFTPTPSVDFMVFLLFGGGSCTGSSKRAKDATTAHP